MDHPRPTTRVFFAQAALSVLAAAGLLALQMQAASPDAPLPPAVKAVWDLDKASHEKTTTRERICLNGLWRWQPAQDLASPVPDGQWGFFKVPGYWPGNSNYIQEDCQTLHLHPAWKDADLRSATMAWHQREFSVPADWAGRRIGLNVDCLNSFALVYVDGKKVAELRYPSGEANLSAVCRAGGKHVLSILVVALPLKGVMLSYSDTNSARAVKGTVERRGLCGDVYLTSVPPAARIADVRVDPSVRKGELTVNAAFAGLKEQGQYSLRVAVM
jgi:beta-galactosidase